jgi:hypothetical protein
LKEHPTSIETVAARLTEAVCLVALRHATVDSWADLELELWKALTETLQRMGTDCLELPQRKPTREADAVIAGCVSCKSRAPRTRAACDPGGGEGGPRLYVQVAEAEPAVSVSVRVPLGRAMRPVNV